MISVKELTSGAKESINASHETSSAIERMAPGVNTQVVKAQESEQLLEQMNHWVKQVYESSTIVSKTSLNTTIQALEVKRKLLLKLRKWKLLLFL